MVGCNTASFPKMNEMRALVLSAGIFHPSFFEFVFSDAIVITNQ